MRVALWSGLLLAGQACASQPADWVNPFIGTGGHGHTFPGAVRPFGMMQLSPDTRADNSWDGCSGYHYSDSVILGFSHTHLSGTGVSDYGDILLMPVAGQARFQPLQNGNAREGYASKFDHRHEDAEPGYYTVLLHDDTIVAELTVADRSGMHRYHFPAGKPAYVMLDLLHRDRVLDAGIQVRSAQSLSGWRHSAAWAANQMIFFYLETSHPFQLIPAPPPYARHVFALAFGDSLTGPLTIKVGISQTDESGAEKNLKAEIPHWNFEQVRQQATATWNYLLGRIDIAGATVDQRTTFYTALYHCCIHPSLASDVDGRYRGRDFNIHQLEPGRNYYTIFSLWDTYRALHPLLTFLDEQRTADILHTLLLQYEQGGALPVWELSANETYCMIGYHAVSVLADAAVKGYPFDWQKALKAMVGSARQPRHGIPQFRSQGFVGVSDDAESVSKTLEYAYDDWCIAQVALLTGDTATAAEFLASAQSWKNLFDPSTGFFRARRNANWYSPFDPYEVNFNYTEANAWQYRHAVPHDIGGLMEFLGGPQRLAQTLDSLFAALPVTTGRQQPDISGMMGQYAHGNEPSHHVAYLYAYCGQHRKTQSLVRRICSEFYGNHPEGLIGNDDCGQMSAWYVFSSMGFYPVTPGYPYYTLGAPLFDTVRIHTPRGSFRIIATGEGYARSFLLNGQQVHTPLLPHDALLQGAELIVQRSLHADEPFPVSVLFPPSQQLARNPITPVPLIVSESHAFSDSLVVHITPLGNRDVIYVQYPTDSLQRYCGAIVLKTSATITARAYDSVTGNYSQAARAAFLKRNSQHKVVYHTLYDAQYTGGGHAALLDGIYGSRQFRDGSWQGWWGKNLQITLDLGADTRISTVALSVLCDAGSWIMYPAVVEIELQRSAGRHAGKPYKVFIDDNECNDAVVQHRLITWKCPRPVKARYIHIKAVPRPALPSWHPAAGQPAWIFCDEILID